MLELTITLWKQRLRRCILLQAFAAQRGALGCHRHCWILPAAQRTFIPSGVPHANDELFSPRNSLRDHLQSRREQALAEIERYDANRFLNSNPEDLASYFTQKCEVAVPVILEDGITADQRETKSTFPEDSSTAHGQVSASSYPVPNLRYMFRSMVKST